MRTNHVAGFGLAQVGAATVALALSALREAVACPPQLDAMPVRCNGLAGSLNLRGDVLPVLDLRTHLDVTQPATPDRVVLVVDDDGHRFGVLVDTVRDVLRPADADVRAVSITADAPLVSHVFRDASTGAPVSVVDAGALRRLPGVPAIRDARPVAGAGDAAAADGDSGTLAIVRCGTYTLGLDTRLVHTILPASAPTAVVRTGLTHGFVRYDGRQLPVVDPLALLGAGRVGPGDVAAHVVLRLGAGFVILAVTELATLQRVMSDQIMPVPASVLPRGRLLAGLVEWDGEQCLVLDPAALADDPDVADLAAASVVCDADTAAASAVAAGRGAAYLSYRAGGEFATALDQIVEIIPVPAGYPVTGTGDGLLGVTAHRAAALPLICLATRLGKRPAPDNPCVLVVDIAGTQTGFVVDGLGAIDTADWSGRTGAAADRDPERRRLVRMRDSGRTVTELDLRAFS